MRYLTSCGGIEITANGSVLTLPSGAVVPGVPEGTEEQAAAAREMGYGDDTLAMVQDHDPLHLLLCAWLGLPCSFVMEVVSGAASGSEIAEIEEAAALAVQKLMRHARLRVTDVIRNQGQGLMTIANEIAAGSVASAALLLMNTCYSASKAAGWHNDLKTGLPRTAEQNDEMFPTRIALAHSELSEALEGHRKGLMDEHLHGRLSAEVELADAVIRVFDLAGAMNYDLGGAIAEKLAYNARRMDHKPESRANAGGKKY